MNPELSVVIPIYKVEDYLPRCIDSVLNQKYTDFEVILVDDGSPDNCPIICDEYAKKDDRIKVIHKKNGGLSSARNAGINMATGKYIAFLDSDDAWAADELEKVMISMRHDDAEMLMFSSIDRTADGSFFERRDMNALLSLERDKVLSVDKYYSFLINEGNLHESACTKVLSLSFLKGNGLFFQEGIISEDTEWMFRLLRVCENIRVSNRRLFICTIDRVGSISNTQGEKSVSDLIRIIRQSTEYYETNQNRVQQYEMAHCAYLLSIVLGMYGNLSVKLKKKYKDDIKSLCWLLELNNSRKVKLVRVIYNIFGLEICAWILGNYIKENKKRMLGRKKIDV